MDMVNDQLPGTSELGFNGSEPTFSLSAQSGEGFDALIGRLTKYAETFLVGAEVLIGDP